MNYDLSFENVTSGKVSVKIRKVIVLITNNRYIAVESSQDGWFEFISTDDNKLPANSKFNSDMRGFIVSENELHKIKLQLGL
jgi:hypothetical protein